MRVYTGLLGGLIAAALAGGAAAQTADEVAAAERAFAARAMEVGITDSFREFAAPDGLIFRPDPINAQADLAKQPSSKGPPYLKWWPVWAGIAASGDLGFTTGPATFDDRAIGYYFTIWIKQPDGAWRWAMDHGSGPTRGEAPGPDTPLARLAATPERSASAEAAFADAKAADARLNAGLATGAAAAFAAVLQDDSRVMGMGVPLTSGRAEATAALAARPQGVVAKPLGGAASKAGDLAYTYGDASWTAAGGGERRGHYVRVWQKRDGGWRLLFDELVPVPRPRPA